LGDGRFGLGVALGGELVKPADELGAEGVVDAVCLFELLPALAGFGQGDAQQEAAKLSD
jgi:hypothetical protein